MEKISTLFFVVVEKGPYLEAWFALKNGVWVWNLFYSSSLLGVFCKLKHTEKGAKDKREILKKIFFLFFHNNVHYAYSLEVP